jgi:hypothetical protein
MKVSKAIEYLKDYDPNDELLIAWWDRETTGHDDISVEEWSKMVQIIDRQDSVFEDVSWYIDEARREVKGE